MTDYPIIRQLPNGCQVRIGWFACDRRYRAELTLPDGEVLRHSAGPPDGESCSGADAPVVLLVNWAWAEAEKLMTMTQERTKI